MSKRSQNERSRWGPWCVPGMLLILFGSLANLQELANFGISMLAMWLVYYGWMKRYHIAWSVLWMGVSLLYLVMGLVELFRGIG